MTEQPPAPGARIRAARNAKKYSQRDLAKELQHVASRHGATLPDADSLVTLISRWENGKHLPDGLYRDLLAKALDTSLDALDLDPDTAEAITRPPIGPGTLIADDDHATLTYNDGSYDLRMRRTLHNASPQVVVRYLVRISVDKYPNDPDVSKAHYRKHPLDLQETAFRAWCEDEPMHWEIKSDRDAVKELWLLFQNDDIRFPLYPGKTTTIHYTYQVSETKWGQWFQRAVRLPTRRLSVDLDFPAALAPIVWGIENSPTADEHPVLPPIQRHHNGDRVRFTWATDAPTLMSRYRLEWTFRPQDPGDPPA